MESWLRGKIKSLHFKYFFKTTFLSKKRSTKEHSTQRYNSTGRMENWMWDSFHIAEWEKRLAYHKEFLQRHEEWAKRTLYGPSNRTIRRREQESRLALFDELPDKERKLFPGKSFALFPKLPLELRRKIWRATFEPRHVDLSIVEWDMPSRMIHAGREPILPYIPMALSINRESRTEALKYYCYIFDNYANPSINPNGLHPPVAFSPRLDSGYIQYIDESHEYWDLVDGKLLSYIDSVAPGGIRALKRLQVQWMRWSSEFKLALETGKPSVSGMGSGILHLVNTILRFSGLKELQLVLVDLHSRNLPNDGVGLMKNPGTMKDCRKSIQSFLDSHKEQFRGNIAPTVTVYYQAKDKSQADGYAYSNSTGEKWVALPWADRNGWQNLEGGTDLATKFKILSDEAKQSEQT